VLDKEKQEESRVPEWLQDVTEEEPKPEEAEQEPPEWLPPIEEPLVDADVDIQPTQPEDWQPEAEIKPEPKAPAKKKTPAKKLEDSEALEAAREALQEGDLEDAAEVYGKLIKRGKLVEEIIEDIQEALRRHPVDPGLWQTLGDAYTRENLLKEALDSYTKAEELLR
jgi:tetratricopeptide (TPR) repeat protein